MTMKITTKNGWEMHSSRASQRPTEKRTTLPNVSEPTVVRHYTNISHMNYGIDIGFYPLGSCTMKYNPRINEDIARLDGFQNLHPLSMKTVIKVLCN